MQSSAAVHPSILTIFGITGDLARTRLIPSLYHLEISKSLTKDFYIVAVSRRKLLKSDIRKSLVQQLKQRGIPVDQAIISRLLKRFYICHIEITKEDDYKTLKQYLDKIETDRKLCLNRLFYLSIPPTLFASVVEKLGKANLHKGCQHEKGKSRLLIEKPFGYSLDSARELIRKIGNYFKEPQVFRIDHYLAKETAQSIIQFRFENPLIDAIWNSKFIDHVQITVAETIGIQNRVNFFEQTGMLRDVVQSHIIQLMALVAMERPSSQDAKSIHQARYNLMRSIELLQPDRINQLTVRAQYTAEAGLRSYRSEVGNSKSNVETYAAVGFNINNKRWAGVPFVIRAGKRLNKDVTSVTLIFKDRTHRKRPANTLTLRIDPNEGIILDLLVKKPGLVNSTHPVKMDFLYSRSFTEKNLSAYERLLLNAISGDRTLFTTSKEMLASWQVIQPILDGWQNKNNKLHFYKAGSWGPAAADKLVAMHGCEWLDMSV